MKRVLDDLYDLFFGDYRTLFGDLLDPAFGYVIVSMFENPANFEEAAVNFQVFCHLV